MEGEGGVWRERERKGVGDEGCGAEGGMDGMSWMQCIGLRRSAESQTCNGTRSRVPRESAFNITRPP